MKEILDADAVGAATKAPGAPSTQLPGDIVLKKSFSPGRSFVISRKENSQSCDQSPDEESICNFQDAPLCRLAFPPNDEGYEEASDLFEFIQDRMDLQFDYVKPNSTG